VTGVLPITVTPVNFTNVNTDIPTAISGPGYVYTGAVLLPTAPGTIPDCYDYENPSNYTSECVAMATFWGITIKQMVTWNPSLVNKAPVSSTWKTATASCGMKTALPISTAGSNK
jgi:hypothetical protein